MLRLVKKWYQVKLAFSSNSSFELIAVLITNGFASIYKDTLGFFNISKKVRVLMDDKVY